FQFRTDIRFDALLWGCFVAIVGSDARLSARLSRFLGAWPWSALFFLVVIGSCSHEIPRAGYWRPLVFPVLVLTTISRSHGTFHSVLESRVLRWIGRLSYSLYLWQQLFFLCFADNMLPFAPQYNLPVSLLLTLGCAMISYHLVERPLIRAGHRLAT